MTILIPAYEPDDRLLDLIIQLLNCELGPIVVIDDGSGPAYSRIFALVKSLRCTVLTHEANLGKGRALKTGFAHIQRAGLPGPIITADSDGQHLPHDIQRIYEAVQKQTVPGMVLGSRRFSGKVPLRSRFGNTVTRAVFTLTTGNKVYDTQTGLRGFPLSMVSWLSDLPGERFEYEMNMLLTANTAGYPITEEYIDTVYLDENKSSHFRPVADSMRIYYPILLFSTSSLISALLDFALLFIVHYFSSSLLLSVVVARLCSSVFNYSMNRRYVFTGGHTKRVYQSFPKYFALVLLILLLNYGLLYFYNEKLIIPLLAAKILTEASIFVFSYWAQRRFVY